MKSLILAIWLAFTAFISPTQAIEIGKWRILEVKDVYVDYMRYKYAQDPYLAPTYHPKDRLDLHLDLEMMNGFIFFDNMVHSLTDESQYRLVGWNYRAGVHILNFADVYIEHFSQHLLDYVPASTNSYDALGIRIYFYRRDK